jgi:hypothetical protein
LRTPILRYLALYRPGIYRTFLLTYDIFLFTTPSVLFSLFLSLLYIHFYSEELEPAEGTLPPYPKPEHRTDLFLLLGEVHDQLEPVPSAHPHWLSIPERGLYM